MASSSLSAAGGCGALSSEPFAASGGGSTSPAPAAAGGGAGGVAARGPLVPVSFTDFKISDFLKDHFKAIKATPDLWTHSHIVNGRDKELNDLLTDARFAKINRINGVEPEFKLTPLHLAVIFGKYELAQKLIEEGAKVESEDANGWTALHHAKVLGDERVIALLVASGATEKKDAMNGTPSDLHDLIYGKVDPLAQRFFYRKEEAIVEGTGKDFYELIGREFSTKMKAAIGDLYFDWSKYFGTPPSKRTELSPSDRALLRAYERRVREDSPCYIEADPLTGFTLRARREILLGEVIEVYTGQFVPHTLTGHEHEMFRRARCPDEPTVYDAAGVLNHDVRALASFSDDSFPNAISTPVLHVHGLARQPLVIAFDTIRKGDKICWHYGLSHSVKLYARRELRPKALERFAKERHLVSEKAMNDLLAYTSDPKNNALTNFGLGVQLQYLYFTQLSLLTLYAKGLISITSIIRLMMASLVHLQRARGIRPEIAGHHEQIVGVIDILRSLESESQELGKRDPAVLAAYQTSELEIKAKFLRQLEEKALSQEEVVDLFKSFERSLMEAFKIAKG